MWTLVAGRPWPLPAPRGSLAVDTDSGRALCWAFSGGGTKGEAEVTDACRRHRCAARALDNGETVLIQPGGWGWGSQPPRGLDFGAGCVRMSRRSLHRDVAEGHGTPRCLCAFSHAVPSAWGQQTQACPRPPHPPHRLAAFGTSRAWTPWLPLCCRPSSPQGSAPQALSTTDAPLYTPRALRRPSLLQSSAGCSVPRCPLKSSAHAHSLAFDDMG